MELENKNRYCKSCRQCAAFERAVYQWEGAVDMHPYYGPNAKLLQEKEGTKSWYLGLVSMGMYLVFWAGVFLVTVRLFKKYLTDQEQEKYETDEALRILRERYAKGEITAREYKKMKCRLM